MAELETVTVSNLPNAATPLSGSERILLDQVTGSAIAAASLVIGKAYRIEVLGNTNWLACGVHSGVTPAVGLTFKATALGSGTGTAIEVRTVDASVQAIADLADLAASTDLSYDPATRLLSSSTGTDVTLPLVSPTVAGLMSSAHATALANLETRLNAFRDAATFYVSNRATASNSNNGTSDGEPFATIGAAYAAANAYVVANPGALARIVVGPGVFTEASLPFRSRPNIYAQGSSQRGTTIKPAAGQELNGFFALDSGCMVEGFRFAGHQATGTSATDSNVGTRAWAIRFNEQANGGLGPIIYASPYVKDCASITAEDDEGLAGSTSTGDTGGGIEVDGAKCHPSSPVRSMVVYGYTQQNLGGPGVVIKNDAYCELVSFFGLFCTWHVRAETGGWATLSGGGCSEFGLYGVVANGYSPTPLFTGSVRVVALAGATQVDVVSLTSNRIGSSNRPHNGQVVILGANTYVVSSSVPINSLGVEVADDSPSKAGYRVRVYNPTSSGLVANVPQGTTADFRRISRVSAGAHTALFVGSGTNYNALPWNGGIPVRANQFVEENFGRVYGLSVNDAGDIYAASGAFQIDGTTGSVTISTDQFNLSGLDGIGPFTRGGGAPVGVQAKEFSNSVTLLASTGASASDTLPTQFAVRSYVDNRFLANITAMAGQPLTITDTSTQDGQGFWTRTRNIAIATGYSIPTDTRQDDWDAAFTQRRTWDGGNQHLNAETGRASLELATVASTGAYSDLLGLPSLGTAAAAATSDFVSATATGAANLVFAGPASGAAAAPTLRALVAADLPFAISTTSAQNLAATAAAGSSGQVADAAHVHQFQPTDIVIPLSGESAAISLSTLLTIPYWPRPQVFTAVPVWMLNGAPTGAAMQLDIRVGGTSIFSTLPTIAAGATNSTTATPAVFSTAFVSGGQIIALGSSVTFVCTQVGTGGGTGLKVAIPARRAA
jgi:hypothetical protein